MDPEATIYETAKSYASDRSEADIRELLGGFGFHGEAIEKKVMVLSGGEKVRLGLARLLLRPLNFLMLDEPTTHLDIHAREALQEALAKYPGTVALVSHDIEFVRGVANTVYAMEPGGVRKYYGGYDYYREKLAEEQAAAAAAIEAAAQTAKTAAPPQQTAATAKKENKPQISYKDRKREESQLRQTYGKLRRPHEAIVAECEEKIDALEKEQNQIYEALNNPGENVDFAALRKRLDEINAESENLTWKWEEASTELEKLKAEFDERLGN